MCMFSLQNIFVKQLTQKGSLRQCCSADIYGRTRLPLESISPGVKAAKPALSRPFTRCQGCQGCPCKTVYQVPACRCPDAHCILPWGSHQFIFFIIFIIILTHQGEWVTSITSRASGGAKNSLRESTMNKRQPLLIASYNRIQMLKMMYSSLGK